MTQSGSNIVPFAPIKITGDSSETMNPAIMQFIMLASIAAQQSKVRLLEESKVPTGSKSFTWNVTDTEKEIVLGTPWISFSLLNDGSNNVYIRINTLDGNMTNEAGIKSGERYTFNATYPLITKIYLVCNSGEGATVRVYAEEGKCQ